MFRDQRPRVTQERSRLGEAPRVLRERIKESHFFPDNIGVQKLQDVWHAYLERLDDAELDQIFSEMYNRNYKMFDDFSRVKCVELLSDPQYDPKNARDHIERMKDFPLTVLHCYHLMARDSDFEGMLSHDVNVPWKKRLTRSTQPNETTIQAYREKRAQALVHADRTINYRKNEFGDTELIPREEKTTRRSSRRPLRTLYTVMQDKHEDSVAIQYSVHWTDVRPYTVSFF
jgi:hypothetical protein